MHKTSKTISTYIRNNQYEDGQAYRITTVGESANRDQSPCGPMRPSDAVDYRDLTQTSLEDCISVTTRDELEKLRMFLVVQEEKCSTHEVEVQIACPCDENHVDELKANKSKNNRLIACGMALLAAIVFGFSKK